MKQWSLDARSEGRFAYSPYGEGEESEEPRSTAEVNRLGSHPAWLVSPVSYYRLTSPVLLTFDLPERFRYRNRTVEDRVSIHA